MTPSGQRHIKLSPPTIHQMFLMHTHLNTVPHSVARRVSYVVHLWRRRRPHNCCNCVVYYCLLCALRVTARILNQHRTQHTDKLTFCMCVVVFLFYCYHGCKDNRARLMVKHGSIYSVSPSTLKTTCTCV